jgi:hypothetical protein
MVGTPVIRLNHFAAPLANQPQIYAGRVLLRIFHASPGPGAGIFFTPNSPCDVKTPLVMFTPLYLISAFSR